MMDWVVITVIIYATGSLVLLIGALVEAYNSYKEMKRCD